MNDDFIAADKRIKLKRFRPVDSTRLAQRASG